MQIQEVKIRQFKNLTDFQIAFSDQQTKTVLIGQNASGKSNFLEAVVLIFKCLDFDFDIKKVDDEELFSGFSVVYRCNDYNIDIIYNPDKKVSWNIKIDGESKSKKHFIDKKNDYLPRYILAYYSGLGNNNKLEHHFDDHKRNFATVVVKADKLSLPEYPRMQYVELIHSQLSLFSFFIDDDERLNEFLKNNLNIEDIYSTLLSIKEPEWVKNNSKSKDKFWGSTGIVRALLDYLHDQVAIAPIHDIVTNKGSFWKNEKKKSEVIYLYFSDFSKIRQFVKDNKWTSFDFFHILNTANVSRLLTQEGIKIRVKKKYANKISFKDLSEGEQQLLTVLGLMRFTAGKETLFLLDEPDTHLNPYWRWKYLDFIDEIVFDKSALPSKNNTTQVIMTSHDPLTIGSLKKEGVRIFDSIEGKIRSYMPSEDPKGMGVAGILTEIFKLQTTLDITTQEQVDERRTLESKKLNSIPLTKFEEKRLEELNEILNDLGFSRFNRDPLYQKFQAAFEKQLKSQHQTYAPLSKEDETKQKEHIEKLLKRILEDEGF